MRTVVASLVIGLLLAGAAVGGGALKSGPQAGQDVPGPFHPLNVTGEHAGEKHCLYCEMGPNPVAMIFAREVSPGLTKLIKKIDAETAKNGKHMMGSFVVFLSNQETLEKDLQNLAKKEAIKTTILSIDNPGGPARYGVAKEADVTVVLYNEHQVVVNRAFRKGELDDPATNRIVAEIPKILPK